MYRKIISKSEAVFASPAECRMLKQMYAQIDTTSQSILSDVFNKLACDVSDLSVFVQQDTDRVHAASLAVLQENKKASVLSIL